MTASACADRRRRILDRTLTVWVVDPWQRKSYDEWAARLGEDRMRGVLSMLDAQLRDLLRLTREDGAETLHRLAHDVASTAGMLGFAEVTRCCRVVLEDEGNAQAVAALGVALEGAIARLERHFAAEAQDAKAA